MSYKKDKGKEEEYYREHLLPKFAKMERQDVPNEIWQNVQANIKEEKNIRSVFDRSNVFLLPRYAFAAAAVFVFISLSAVGYREISMYKEVNQRLNFMVSYLSSDLSLVGEEVQL